MHSSSSDSIQEALTSTGHHIGSEFNSLAEREGDIIEKAKRLKMINNSFQQRSKELIDYASQLSERKSALASDISELESLKQHKLARTTREIDEFSRTYENLTMESQINEQKTQRIKNQSKSLQKHLDDLSKKHESLLKTERSIIIHEKYFPIDRDRAELQVLSQNINQVNIQLYEYESKITQTEMKIVDLQSALLHEVRKQKDLFSQIEQANSVQSVKATSLNEQRKEKSERVGQYELEQLRLSSNIDRLRNSIVQLQTHDTHLSLSIHKTKSQTEDLLDLISEKKSQLLQITSQSKETKKMNSIISDRRNKAEQAKSLEIAHLQAEVDSTQQKIGKEKYSQLEQKHNISSLEREIQQLDMKIQDAAECAALINSTLKDLKKKEKEKKEKRKQNAEKIDKQAELLTTLHRHIATAERENKALSNHQPHTLFFDTNFETKPSKTLIQIKSVRKEMREIERLIAAEETKIMTMKRSISMTHCALNDAQILPMYRAVDPENAYLEMKRIEVALLEQKVNMKEKAILRKRQNMSIQNENILNKKAYDFGNDTVLVIHTKSQKCERRSMKTVDVTKLLEIEKLEKILEAVKMENCMWRTNMKFDSEVMLDSWKRQLGRLDYRL